MQCVVLAGGLATRMRPLTERVPKVLLEVGGRPFLHHQLRLMAEQGVTEVVLALGHLGEQVEQQLATSPPPVPVRVVREAEPLGTAGALRNCLEAGVLDERFLLTWGDSFLPIDWRPVWRAFTGEALMTVLENEGRWDTSNVVFESGELKLYDKSRAGAPAKAFRHIDYGLLALDRRVVEGLPRGRSDLATLFHLLSREGRLQGYEVRHRFFEIGSPQGLADLEQHFRAPVLVVLDRDGVLNRTVAHADDPRDSPLVPSEVELLPGVAEAVKLMHARGASLAIASNQPAAAKGKTTRANAEAVHARVLELLGPVGVRSHLCWHRREDGCACRKPKPQLVLDAMAEAPGLETWFVGDKHTDHEAGRAAGVRTALVSPASGDADWVGASLPAFVRFLSALKGW
ncbi:MAG: HAD-IIIA family hydrolase [Myxococcaceae bacterium]|nr:HAD-IIIA family hydrolase [Myxococcaceae bacterium]